MERSGGGGDLEDRECVEARPHLAVNLENGRYPCCYECACVTRCTAIAKCDILLGSALLRVWFPREDKSQEAFDAPVHGDREHCDSGEHTYERKAIDRAKLQGSDDER